jgi:hypothetical protein
MHGGEIAQTVARVGLVSAVVAVVAWVVWKPLDSTLGHSFGAQVVSLGLALSASILTYFVGCRLLRVRELDTLASVWSRLRRA